MRHTSTSAKTRERAAGAIWWPHISKDIKVMVESYAVCQQHRVTQREQPLKPVPLPERPWAQLGADLFEYKKEDVPRGGGLLFALDRSQAVDYHHQCLSHQSAEGNLHDIWHSRCPHHGQWPAILSWGICSLCQELGVWSPHHQPLQAARKWDGREGP